MKTRLAEGAIFLVPLGLVAALGWSTVPMILEISRTDQALTLLGSISASLVLLYGYGRTRPGLSIRSVPSWVRLLIVGSVGLYLWGLYPQQDFMLAWFGMIFTYVALVAYLGGTAYFRPLSLPVAVLGMMMSPWYGLGSAIRPSLIELPLMATAGVASALLLFQRTRRRVLAKDCEYCPRYRSDGQRFCLYCGRTFGGKTGTSLGGMRRWGFLMAAAVVLPLLAEGAILLSTPAPTELLSVVAGFAETNVGSYLPSGPSNQEAYLLSGAAAIGITTVAALVRTLGFKGSVAFDNSLGLNQSQFAVLAAISKPGVKLTGSELFEECGKDAGVQNWSSFESTLLRFKHLGLVQATVATKNGVPELVWKCTLGV